MFRMTGAELLVGLLQRQGVDCIAGIPGGANLPLYDALYHVFGIRHILCRHEQGAGFLAQGLARSRGKTAVCIATSGPGATNIVTAIADAYLDSIPLVCITGQVPSGLIGTDAFQEVDTYGLSIPITKHNFIVRSAEELLRIVPEAFELAISGRPGPVWIDIPKDVQTDIVAFRSWPAPGMRRPVLPVRARLLEQAAELISSAMRPVLCLGGGIVHAGAATEARALIEKCALPTVTTLMGLGTLPTNHPLFLGMLGMHGNRYTNLALQECDLFIAAGARFDDRATGKLIEFCPKASVLHIDIDPAELSKLKVATVGISGDLKPILTELLPLTESVDRRGWHGRIDELRRQYPPVSVAFPGPASPHEYIRAVARHLDDDGIIVTDVGKHQMWVAQVFPFQFPRQFITSGGLGTMGFGLPTAIGVALANPDRQVVLITGDGSVQMNIQELATAVEQQVNLKIIVMNNHSLGLVRQQQKLFFNRHYFACEFKTRVDFALIAKGFGMKSYDMGDAGEFSDLVQRLFAEPGPCLLNVDIDDEEDVYPMVPPGAANSEMIGGLHVE